jgi:hypothetical protein
MRVNGLQLVVDMAVDALGDPRVSEHRGALVLGTLRENVRFVPGLGVLDEHLSLSHFCGAHLPGGFFPLITVSAARRGGKLFAAALAEKRAGKLASAFVQMGRVAHLVADMACPVHVHRVAHWTDPFEWWVEAHCDELARMPVERPPAAAPRALIGALARRTQAHAPDRTHNALGWVLRSVGLRRPRRREELEAQARQIVPDAAGTLATLLAMFVESA